MGYHLHVDSDPIHVGQTIVGEPLGRIAIRHEVKQEGAEAGVRNHRRRPGQLQNASCELGMMELLIRPDTRWTALAAADH